MVRLIQPGIPAEYEELWNKIVRWFGLKGVPTFARLWSQNTRRMFAIRYTISKFMSVGAAWRALSFEQQQAWRDAANVAWGYNRGYRLFTADYIYRLFAGLPVPGDPSNYHQLFGLEMSNPDGLADIQMRRDDKDLVGPIDIAFKYKKIEVTPSALHCFKVACTGWYLTQGGVGVDTDEWNLPAGNIDWTVFTQTFGVEDRQYFHWKIVISITNYDSKVYFNSLDLADKNGNFFSENWITERYEPWVPTRLYRKKDWLFTPEWPNNYFQHLYLQN